MRSCIVCAVLCHFRTWAADNASCPAGTGRCSDGISEEGEQSTWSRLTSIIFNKKTEFDSYAGRFSDNGTLEERKTTDEYYDLATDFYEYGWGSSFHFATRYKGESLPESIKRHEDFLALKLGMKYGDKVADLGMGVGGPLRNIAKFTGASITGVTINDYQVRRAKQITRQRESAAAASRMNYVHGDFTNLVPKVFKAGTLDSVYYIESACHISNRKEIFAESARALRKGGKLFTYEWVMTERYDPTNESHQTIKKGVEWGNGIEDLVSYKVPLEALEQSGFKVLEHGDLVDMAEEWYGEHNVPWYFDIAREWSFKSIDAFKLSKFGQHTLAKVLWFVEKIGLVPGGASATEAMLRHGAVNLVAGGQTKVFTPMYYIVAEKL